MPDIFFNIYVKYLLRLLLKKVASLLVSPYRYISTFNHTFFYTYAKYLLSEVIHFINEMNHCAPGVPLSLYIDF